MKTWNQRAPASFADLASAETLRAGQLPSPVAAFTMIEVAIALGIIAFALVAIIGVLPSGMTVQRENREDTIVNQDASYLLEAIRSGSQGLDDLTNYVESITVTRGNQVYRYTNNVVNPGGLQPLINGLQIISLLSTPKLERLPDKTYRFNTVKARVRAMSGGALDKGKGMTDFAFRYQLTAEVMPLTNVPPFVNVSLSDAIRSVNLAENLYDVRLLLQWPLFQQGTTWNVGRHRRTVRTLVSGELLPILTNSSATANLYMFQPDTFISYH